MTADMKRARLIQRLEAERASGLATDIAIIGLAGRYPGVGADGTGTAGNAADTIDSAGALDALWDNLQAGLDAIGEIPAQRWDWRDPVFFEADKAKAVASGRSYARWGAFLPGGIDRFDSLLFGIAPREAEIMDPQERLFLEAAWHAVEDAGYRRSDLAGRRIAVYAGAMFAHYQMLQGADAIPTSSFSAIANRVSHVFDWRGPSLGIDTMCSSSLTALQLACDSLRRGDTELALAGGVNLIIHPTKYTLLCQGRFASTDGHCRSFGAGGDGYVPGEGVGVVLLKPLAAALADGDPIWGRIKGGALNHGGRAAGGGFTVPSPLAQADVVTAALHAAAVDGAGIGYVEAHGTGTSLGDPIEVSGLSKAYGARAPLPIGSIKGNLGHLESAAGIAGLTKILLQFRYRTLVPSLTHGTDGAVNPEIDFDATALRLQVDAAPWTAAGPLRAGLSAFGAGGSNAHLVLEEHRQSVAEEGMQAPALVVLSARNGEQLRAYAAHLLRFIERHPVALPALAHTLQVGREAMAARLAVVVDSVAQLRQRLGDYLAGAQQAVLQGVCSDQIMRAAAEHSPVPWQGSDLLELGRRWVAGEAVGWPVATSAAHLRRIHLPGYPMARTRHWLKPAAPVDTTTVLPAAVLHPLLDRNISTLGETVFARRFLPDELWVRDHRFRTTMLLPAAAIIEMARAAGALAAPARPLFAIADVVWLRPLQVGPDGADAHLVLKDDAAGARFALQTPGGEIYARGLLQFDSTAYIGERIDLAALLARCPQMSEGAEGYRQLAAGGLEYGPAFRVLERCWRGTDEVVACLRLAGAGSDALVLHPALLDGALQALAALPMGDGAAALPFAVEAVQWGTLALPALCYVHVRRRAAQPMMVDMQLFDADGNNCLCLRGVTVRAVRPAALAATVSMPVAAVAAPTAASTAQPALLDYLAELVGKELRLAVADISMHGDFEQYGLQSTQVMDMTDVLERRFGPLPKTLFFEYRTLQELADYFMAQHGVLVERLWGGAAAAAAVPAATVASMGTETVPPLVAKLADASGDIAVIGLAGRYPQARTLAAFWDNLRAGRDSIETVPQQRWDAALQALTDDGKPISCWGGFIEDVERFDAHFFRMAPREAELIDPQERLFLETVWQALEDAALTRASLSTRQVGVFVGVMHGLYQLHGPQLSRAGASVAPGSAYWSVANRVSSFFNFQGPSMAVDTACSASLSALHLACAALRRGEADLAIAGGVNISSHPQKYLQLAQMNFTSSDGRCRSFGAGGDGYVPGEGIGAAVLKPLHRALADGDPIWGIIKGSAINHGGSSNGYTVPNPAAQAAVVTAALADAGVDPASIDYIEAHGTGTALGDPIEIAGLNRALAGRALHSCPIGSVKSNIGHLESAAGIAGLTKVLLQMQHNELVPSLHAASLNPAAAFAQSPCYVQRELAPWPAPVGRPRRAGLSSFGAGGSNAHLVLEAYQASAAVALPCSGVAQLIVLSARSEDRLLARAADLAQWLATPQDHDLAALAYTLQLGREAMPHRLALVVISIDELRRDLLAIGTGAGAGGWSWRGNGKPEAGLRLPAEAAARAALAQRLLGQMALDEVARHWVAGLEMPWASCYSGQAPRRIRLPVYPFLGPRYWLPVAAQDAATAALSAVGASTTVPLAQPETAAPAALLFEPFWLPSPALPAVSTADQLLVVSDDHDLLAAVQAAAAPATCLAVLLGGAPTMQRSDLMVLERSDAASWTALLHTLQQRQRYPARVLYRPLASGAALEHALHAALPLLGLLRALAARRPVHPVELVCLVAPVASELALAGLLRAAALETAQLRASVVQVAPQLPASAWAASGLAAFGQAAVGEVAVHERRHGALDEAGWQRQWRALAGVPSAGSGLLRQGGVYLITGGAGGLGQVFARALAQRYGARLALVGRSAPDAHTVALLEHLRAAGGDAVYLRGDVGNAADVARVVAETRQRYGAVHGVLHAAGVLRDALMVRKSDADFAAVLGPKIAGADYLDQATADDELDLFVLFSSLAAVAGNVGQTDYAMANRFLDAFAENRAALCAQGQRHGRSLSLNWPYWRDGGMRIDSSGLAGMARLGLAPLEQEAGLQAFFAALAAAAPVIAVAAGAPAPVSALFGIDVPLPETALASAPAARPATAERQAVTAADTGGWLLGRLRAQVSAVLKIPADAIEADESFLEYGFDSVSLASFAAAVNQEFGIDFQLVAFFELHSLTVLAAHLQAEYGPQLRALAPSLPAPPPVPALPPAPELAAAAAAEAVAIIGMAGMLPGATDLDNFWQRLVNGESMITEIPAERWDWRSIDGDPAREPGKLRTRWGGFIADADKFDPRFFGLSAHEAERMDPQQRLCLQMVWSALEDAGCRPSELAGSRTAVYIGVAGSDYNDLFRDQGQPVTALTGTGMAHSVLVNRISYLLDLHGPSEPVDAACASSLVALHKAVEALRNGTSELAIAGGINLLLTPTLFASFEQAGMLSPDGQCRPFDAAANGYVRGEGGGMLVLKRLSQAQADGDPIHAVIRGSAYGHGGRSASLTAPNALAQAEVLQAAWRAAGITPDTLGYIEAHGTGTALGDPIEMAGLLKAFAGAGAAPACALGSVKASIGHLETAAGIAGVLKVLLALRHRTLPPSAYFTHANPQLPDGHEQFTLPIHSQPWRVRHDSAGRPLPRRAGISSFGFGGVNAHMVLEEAPAPVPLSSGRPGPRVIVLSAKTAERLRARGESLQALLAHADAPAFDDICHTLQRGREAYAERFACVAENMATLRSVLAQWLDGAPSGAVWYSGRASAASVAAAGLAPLALAQAWVNGAVVDWRACCPHDGGRKVHLPAYPFARERYWIPLPAQQQAVLPAPPAQIHAQAAPSQAQRSGLLEQLRDIIAEVSGFSRAQVEPTTELALLGFDSLMAKNLHIRLEQLAGQLPPSLIFECNTLAALTEHLLLHAPGLRLGAAVPVTASTATVAGAAVASTAVRQPVGATEPIAVIGLAGRYPDAPDLATFWDHLSQGHDSVREVPADRWDWRRYWHADPEAAQQGGIYARWGAFLQDADRFDALFFQLSPAEAELMDPQERLFLETVWATLEDAGYTRSNLASQAGKPRVGVFAGITTLSHALWGPPQWQRGEMAMPAAHPWSIANRVSYAFDFTGPSMPVDTACSSSLSAIHLACDSLRRGECEVAVAGGVNLYTHPAKYLALCQMHMLSPTGHSRSFGAQADGFVPGEGVGAVLLKPLRQAEADGDHIHAVIRGSAINHSGKTNGYTVPSPAAQAAVIRAALAAAGVPVASIGYVEAHGTGTALGDPIEFDGLVQALDGASGQAPLCLLGSVKSGIGHLEAAAGIAGLTKIILQLRAGAVAPTLHADTVNPAIVPERTRFRLAHALQPWPAQAEGVPRRAGLSSFGAGGANAHLIVEEYLPPARPQPLDVPQLIPLSARDEDRLRAAAQALRARLAQQLPELALADLALTLQDGREAMPERLAIVAAGLPQLQQALDAWLAGQAHAQLWHARAGRDAPLAALFDDSSTLAATLAGWQSAGRLDKVAQLWTAGVDIDWRLLARDGAARRTPLPTYPFAGERYATPTVSGSLWPVPGAAAASAAPIVPIVPIAPVAQMPQPLPAAVAQATSWRYTIGAADPLLLHHQVDGQAILPGVATLALMVAALRAGRADAAVLLDDVVWLRPVDAGAARALRLSLQAGQGLMLAADGDPQCVYAQAFVCATATATPAAVAPHELIRDLPQTTEAAALYRHAARHGVVYGAHFQTLQRVHHGASEAIGVLQLAAGEAPADADGRPHAGLLDGALQVVAVFGLGQLQGSAPVLPACVDTVAFHRALPARAYAHARITGRQRYNVTILDEAGQACMEFIGLTLRPQPAASAGFCYQPQWQPLAAAMPGHGSRNALRVLILAPEPGDGFVAALCACHADDEVEVRAIGALGEPLPAAYLGRFDRLYFFSGHAMQSDGTADWPWQALHQARSSGIHPLFRLLKALALADLEQGPHVSVITDRLHALERASSAVPWNGALPGLMRAAARELPDLRLRCLDVDLGAPDAWAAVARSVVEETARTAPDLAGETEIVVRGASRYALRLTPLALAPVPAPWQQGGVYVIIGGAGGIGTVLAEHLLASQSRVILIGRRAQQALPEALQQRLQRDQAPGAGWTYLQADGGDPVQMAAALETVEQRFGRINGVVHSALVLRDRTLRNLEQDVLDEVLDAKMRSCVVLEELLASRMPDFVLLLSSAQALIGAAGQANYAAASSFEDAYAASWAARAPYPVRLIDWGYWGEVGVVATAQYRSAMAAHGVGSIRPAEGLAVMQAVLAGDYQRVVALKSDTALLEQLGLCPSTVAGSATAPETSPQSDAGIPSVLALLLEAGASDLIREN